MHPDPDSSDLKKPHSVPQDAVSYQSQLSVRSGPLPPPEDLAKYNMVVPDAAERILRMAEKQQEHRMKLEELTVVNNNKRETVGQIFAFVLSALVLAAGVWFAYKNYPTQGATVITTTIVGLATTFLLGRYQQSQERKEKAKIQAGLEPTEPKKIKK